ncbi:MAG: N-acetyltransferase [Bacteroidota bacterium]
MATIDTDILNIHHDTKERKFFLVQKGEDIEDAYVEYELHTDTNPNTMHFVSTYVPKTIRDIGVGKKMTEEAMLFAETNDYQVSSSCPFVQSYMNQTPRFSKLYRR